MTQIEKPHLAHEAEGDPLVVGVVHDVLALAAARALALELLGDVEGGVHPAVGLQRALADSAAREVALYGLPEELVAGDRDGAEDEEGAGPPVEQPEGPVVDGGLLLSYLVSDPAQSPHSICRPNTQYSYQQLRRGGCRREDCRGHHCLTASLPVL